jgi:hypothetical protein
MRGEFSQFDVAGDNKGASELGFRLVLAAPVFSDVARVEELENFLEENPAEQIDSARKITESKSGSINRHSQNTRRYPWKTNIAAKLFFVGEPIDEGPENSKFGDFSVRSQSVWDTKWIEHYGGVDDPDPSKRSGYAPLAFVPRQNPFYVALPYNDVTNGNTKPEALRVIPWFRQAFVKPGRTILKGRWVAVRHSGRTAFAQWEDSGPSRTDHWQYVLGNQRPLPDDQSAGICVSPAVRDYLGLDDGALCDWRFVEFREVPQGPWSDLGDNNTFVHIKRRNDVRGGRSSELHSNSSQMKPPFGFRWGESVDRIVAVLDKSNAEIVQRERTQDGKEQLLVVGIQQEGLISTSFHFVEETLSEVVLNYERPDWSEDRIAQWVSTVKKQADRKYGPSVSLARGSTKSHGPLISGWQWGQSDSQLRLMHVGSMEDGRSASKVLLAYSRTGTDF